MHRTKQWNMVALFAVAMAWVEAAVVTYLRLFGDRIQPYQADPLLILPAVGPIELVREAATMVMLFGLAWLAGHNHPARFAYFLIAFGTWDVSYYVFLRWMGGWPTSLLDWDVLFLLPLPWWGPVLAPVLISLLMITLGTLLTQTGLASTGARIPTTAWIGAALGAALVLAAFMWDALQAVPQGVQAVLAVLPQRFLWPLFLAGLALMTAPLAAGCRTLARSTARRSVTSATFAAPSPRKGADRLPAARPPNKASHD